ncbi:cobalamin biosynthesis protein [Streptomyces sp. SP17BM10]|uniref:cobalamin biosynthesis protein n=1 Tax=Streptomyces sp. SP17BM10 TaxID=3002530 RepID=UPI002E75E3B8|nr:cobalamin biosynthesis protein [Streptomyces sp. SP17BM10]MEE1783289.1 cobalamin biosynthesis protein [Streptomyces sp. SP17BM10]
MIGLIAANGSVRPLAAELHAAWPDSSKVYRPSTGSCFGLPEAIGLALHECEFVICFAPLPGAVRLAEYAGPRGTEGKGLLCVDPRRRYVIPLTGDAGTTELAWEVAAVLGVQPVLTGPPSQRESALAELTRRAAPVAGPDGPATAAPAEEPVLRIPDPEDPDDPDSDLAVLPRTLVLGVGAGSGTEQTEVMRLLMDVLRETGLSRQSVARIATVAGKGEHPAVTWARWCLGRPPVDEHPADALAAVPVPNPSADVATAVGTASVAEAAALASAPGGELVVAKRKSAHATIAIARTALRGRLTLVGLGPGPHDLLVPRALEALRRVSAVVGPPDALAAVAGLLRPATRRIAPEDSAGAATTLASHGHDVALVALGDGAGLSVPPGAYDVLRVPGLPLEHREESEGDPA